MYKTVFFLTKIQHLYKSFHLTFKNCFFTIIIRGKYVQELFDALQNFDDQNVNTLVELKIQQLHIIGLFDVCKIIL